MNGKIGLLDHIFKFEREANGKSVAWEEEGNGSMIF
jgi:hypothetical protein